MKRRILIQGAGIAGPALAVALDPNQWDITVVERAPSLRTGGQAVDFRGPIHRAVLDRLNLWDAIWQRKTPGNELWLLRADGSAIAQIPPVMISGDVEIVRGDLSALLVARSHAKYRFSDCVTAIDDSGNEARVTFASGETGEYDLVVGADGLHSTVRSLCFSNAKVHHEGHRLAIFSMPDQWMLHGRALMYSELGRCVTLTHGGPGRASVQLVFAGPELSREERTNPEVLRALLRTTYAGMQWEMPRILESLERASEIYADSIATVKPGPFSKGRVALLGDSAWGGTLGGQGTSLAIVGAYVLSQELAATPGDLRGALNRFEVKLKPYALECQKGATHAGGFHAPVTRLGMFARNTFYRLMSSKLLSAQFEKLVKSSASSFALPEYANG